MIIVVATSVAFGGDLDFTPDRPGFGDSTGTPGAGHAMIEIGFAGALSSESTTLGTGGLVARIGVDDGVELRLRLPDPFVTEGGTGFGPAAVGAKVGGALNDRWSSSVVAELTADPDDGAVGGVLSGNIALALDAVGIWFVGSAAGSDVLDGFAGGGVGVGSDGGGAYVNAGYAFGTGPLVGIGGYALPDSAFQIDGGIDVGFGGGLLTWQPSIGVSFGF